MTHFKSPVATWTAQIENTFIITENSGRQQCSRISEHGLWRVRELIRKDILRDLTKFCHLIKSERLNLTLPPQFACNVFPLIVQPFSAFTSLEPARAQQRSKCSVFRSRSCWTCAGQYTRGYWALEMWLVRPEMNCRCEINAHFYTFSTKNSECKLHVGTSWLCRRYSSDLPLYGEGWPSV